MSDKSKIEWTDATWNPVRGCTKISPGCAHCYAETFAERWRGIPGHPYEQGFDLRLVPEKLAEPLSWKKPRMVFVNSMSDLFHESVPFEYIDKVFAVMNASRFRLPIARNLDGDPWHTYQVLTKRSGRLLEYVRSRDSALWPKLGSHPLFEAGRGDDGALRGLGGEIMNAGAILAWPLPNVWIGVSVENRKHGLPRIDDVRQTPAAVRFLSIEPLLEDLGPIDLSGIGWVIVGGESGKDARPMHPDWVRSIRDQCVAANVPFFFKQWGEWRPIRVENDSIPVDPRWSDIRAIEHNGNRRLLKLIGKKAAGRDLDGREWNEMPHEVPA